ncbi:MAG: O-antigen ligase family protein [Bacteroidales bacterium]|nr:O-antigen ligase family protein [Bacteroidales bacterium]
MYKILNKNTIPELLLVLVIISIPLPEHWSSKTLLLSLIYLLYQFYVDFKVEFPKFAWTYIIAFLAVSLSLAWTLNQLYTFRGIVSFLPLLMYSIGYKQLISKIDVFKITKISSITYVIYGFVLLALAYFRFTDSHSIDTFYYHSLTEPLQSNAIYIAILFAILNLFLLFKLLFISEKNTFLEYSLTGLLFIFQFFLASKMIISILFAISLVFFVLYFKEKGWNKKITLFSFAIIIGFSLFINLNSFTKERFKNILDHREIKEVFSRDYFGRGYYWTGLTLRLFQLRCFTEIEADPNFNSLTGTGFRSSQKILNQKYEQYDLYRGPSGEGESDGYFVYNFHNQYLQFIIELGIAGVLLILSILYFSIATFLKNKNKLFIAIMMLFLFLALTESFLLRQKGIISFAIFPLLAISYLERTRYKTN